MAVPLVEELIKLENGVIVYDALLQRDIILMAPLLAILSDNPRHSELLNHSGGSAKIFCRMCMVRRYIHACAYTCLHIFTFSITLHMCTHICFHALG